MAIEDFGTYTEEDDNNKLTVTSSKADGVDVDQDEDVYLYKDKGEDFFDALDIDFEIYISSSSLFRGKGGTAITNTISAGHSLADTDVLCLIREHTDSTFFITLYRGANVAFDNYACSADTLYYCTLERAAGNDSASLLIYSDSGRTDLLDTLAVAGFGTEKWQYVYGFINWNYGASGQDFDGYVQNLDLKEVEVTEKTSSDTGSGIDAVISRLLAAIETGSSVEVALFITALISGDGGLGSDLSTLLKAILASDEGSGFDALKALIETGGSDMRLHTRPGHVRIPSKEVNL